MANTFFKIASNTLTSATSIVTFSSIPTTFNDLYILASVRMNDNTYYPQLQANGTFSGWSYTGILGSFGTNSSPNSTSASGAEFSATPSTFTADSFANVQIFVPRYQSTTNKPVFMISTTENANANTNYLSNWAARWTNNAVINTLTLTGGTSQFASGSTFYLYGISNS